MSLVIGNYSFKTPYILAPMAGYSDWVFRRLCMEKGASAAITELISAKALVLGSKQTIKMVQFFPGEDPHWLQLFGFDGDTLAEAALIGINLGAQLIDINMGCPVRKVVNSGAGAAWMKKPFEAGQCIKKIVDKVAGKVPVTVKIRSGWDANEITAVEVAKAVVDNGAAAVSVHGRTRAQFYSGTADWEIIRQVVKAVNGQVPVIGNGDVTGPEGAKTLMDEYGCSGVMVGRAALGNPWVFQNLNAGEIIPVSKEELFATAMRHLLETVERIGEEGRAVRYFRAQASGYFRAFRGAATARRQLSAAQTVSDVEKLLHVAAENVDTEPAPANDYMPDIEL